MDPPQPERFDLIVSDLRMPGFDGLEVLSGLDRDHSPPAILITAFGDRRLHELARRRGVRAVLDKPFPIERLLATIRGLLGPPHAPHPPVAKARERAEGPPARETARAQRILLAEDDADLRELIAATLRRDGWEVLAFANALELLDCVEGHGSWRAPVEFELVISDVRMPGVSGLSLLEGLREWRPPGELRLILISAFGDEALHREAQRLGAAVLLDKPFELSELVARVRELLPPARPTREVGAAARRGRILLAEDDASLRSLFAQELRRRGFDVTECEDGPELVSKLATLVLFGGPCPYDLLISDVRLPGATALEILEAMRHCEALPPVVLITAFAEDATRRAAEKLGAAILDKPVEIASLVEAAQRALAPERRS
jgi:CheY-like chemotaxis protein